MLFKLGHKFELKYIKYNIIKKFKIKLKQYFINKM